MYVNVPFVMHETASERLQQHFRSPFIWVVFAGICIEIVCELT